MIDYDAVRRLNAQLDTMTRIHQSDQLAISELREELMKLRFVNTTCRSKLSKYPKMLEKIKQVRCGGAKKAKKGNMFSH